MLTYTYFIPLLKYSLYLNFRSGLQITYKKKNKRYFKYLNDVYESNDSTVDEVFIMMTSIYLQKKITIFNNKTQWSTDDSQSVDILLLYAGDQKFVPCPLICLDRLHGNVSKLSSAVKKSCIFFSWYTRISVGIPLVSHASNHRCTSSTKVSSVLYF